MFLWGIEYSIVIIIQHYGKWRKCTQICELVSKNISCPTMLTNLPVSGVSVGLCVLNQNKISCSSRDWFNNLFFWLAKDVSCIRWFYFSIAYRNSNNNKTTTTAATATKIAYTILLFALSRLHIILNWIVCTVWCYYYFCDTLQARREF